MFIISLPARGGGESWASPALAAQAHMFFLPFRPRRVEPVCSALQAQILRCYRDNLHEALLCSDLVKTYQHCVSTAHKVRPRLPPGEADPCPPGLAPSDTTYKSLS